jgi:hypothetical protein
LDAGAAAGAGVVWACAAGQTHRQRKRWQQGKAESVFYAYQSLKRKIAGVNPSQLAVYSKHMI